MTRRSVYARTQSSMARIDGSAPPGKMYLWIQVYWWRVASIRSWLEHDGLEADRPPGASSRSRLRKNVGQ